MMAGDISPNPIVNTTDDMDTANILDAARPATVVALGDIQYPSGQYEHYIHPDGYAASWGRPALKAITCPTTGNHDYADPLSTPGHPAGWLRYFSPPCPHRPDLEYATTSAGVRIPTVYAFRPAPGSGWWAYVLDSQCTRGSAVRGPSCDRYGNMLNWFRNHMAAHPAKCRIAFWHHPRFGGWKQPQTGDQQGDQPAYWLYAVAAHAGRVSVIMNAHSHWYQRFTSLTADGAVDSTFTAPRSFTVGTGGVDLIPFSSSPYNINPRVGEKYRDDKHFGVVRLTLGSGNWTSEFDRTDGVVADRASAGC